jgi:hypothetical protein
MTWQGVVEHEQLYGTAHFLITLLKGLSKGLQHGEVEHVIHREAAERCRSLAITTESAVVCAHQDIYGPAFALLRSALEQTLVDKLVFLGRRHVQILKGVTNDQWQMLQAERDSGTAWNDVTHWQRYKNGDVRIVREGIYSEPKEDGTREVLGIHYFLLRQYSPFVGPPTVYEQLNDGFGLLSPEERLAYARQQKAMYDVYLRWASLKENLTYNGFADEACLIKLDCHYRFLSAFVHPISDVTNLLYGKDASYAGWPYYDHYSSELVLLYAIVLAVEELRNFCTMTQQAPTVEIENRRSIEQVCDSAWELSGHLWYPGQPPHAYDRYQEANQRAMRERQSTSPQNWSSPADPIKLSEDEVHYYGNPLRRLVELHASATELTTGLSYNSPWLRNDARVGR